MVERSIQELHQDGVGEKASTGGQDESVGIDMKEQDFLDGASVEIFVGQEVRRFELFLVNKTQILTSV